MKYLRTLLLTACLAAPAAADVLYDNTTLTNAASGIGPEETCGPSGCTQFAAISFDDVLIPLSRDPGGAPIAINQVTVGVGGDPAAGIVSFNLWNFPVLPDGTPGLPRKLIATEDVTFQPGGFQDLTFGNGTSALATIQPNLSAVPGYGLVYLGLSASDTADWFWANGPDFNLPTAWFYSGSTNSFFLNTSSPGFPSNYSYDIQVRGQALPEPSLLLPLAILLATLYRWRIKRLTRGSATDR